MNYTIYLTNRCNLRCKYCYESAINCRYSYNYDGLDVKFEYIKELVNNIVKSNQKVVNIAFYGGEPLIRKDLIIKTVEYIKNKKSKIKFIYTITTNGTLLDEEFLKYAKKNNFLSFAYSIDGNKVANDSNRINTFGESVFNKVKENAVVALKYFPNSIAMMVLTKNNYMNLVENVDYLYKLGFKYFNIQFNYLDDWNENDLERIKDVYEDLANYYFEKIMTLKNITIYLFDDKIVDTFRKNKVNDYCKICKEKFFMGTDGKFYPCVQFVGKKDYIIGNTKDGIDYDKVVALENKRKTGNLICDSCLLKERCKHYCACNNYLSNGDINIVSPVNCIYEKNLIKVVDSFIRRILKVNKNILKYKFLI